MSINPTFASRWNVDEIDRQYALWLESPSNVPTEWQYFFEGFHLGNDSFPVASEENTAQASTPIKNVDVGEKHARLYGAIYSFRDIGHTQATFDPLRDGVEENPRVSLQRLSFQPAD